MRKRCAYCGRYFEPDVRVGDRQKACQAEGCRKRRKGDAQKRWLEKNPGYFRGRYDYVKEWRRKRKVTNEVTDKMIQDEIRPDKSVMTYVLLIPENRTGMIQDEIILRRLNNSTFAACG